jgi:hypothetical protein
MSYTKYLSPPQLAQAQDSVAQQGKKRLGELLSLSPYDTTEMKKSKHSEFYESEEEDEEAEGREEEYEAFYSQWQSLEDRMISIDESVERDWLALKPRITTLLREQEAIGITPPVVVIQSEEQLALEAERALFQSKIQRLKLLEAEIAGRDSVQETAQFQADKEACFRRFKSLQELPLQLREMREDLRKKGLRTLGEPEFRALVKPLNVSTLLASVISSKGTLAYASEAHYVSFVFTEGTASPLPYFIMVHKDVLLL